MSERIETDKLGPRGQVKLESYAYLMQVSNSVKKEIMKRYGGDTPSTYALALLLDVFRDCVVREEQLQRCVIHTIVKEEPYNADDHENS